MKTTSGYFVFRIVRFLVLLLTLAAFAIPGAHGAYTDNGNGTVSDSATGLTWMRCSVGQTWSSSTCTGAAQNYTWYQTQSVTQSFAGQSDWRVPSVRELQTLVNRTLFAPAIDRTAFPNTPATDYWTSTSLVSSTSPYAWEVNFEAGSALASASFKSSTQPIRLVRGSPTSSLLSLVQLKSDYVDHGDGTVTHTPTGLMWKRCVEGQIWSGAGCTGTASKQDWAAANALASNFSGRSDWRLPTAEELLSLVDFTRSDPTAIHSTIFPTTGVDSYWTASTYIGYASYAWFVSFVYGEIGVSSKDNTKQARLVRSVNDGPVVNVASGWNLLGNSVNAPLKVASSFGDGTKVTSVWKWIAPKSGWAFFSPTLSDGGASYAANNGYDFLASVDAGEGFWVQAKAPFTTNLAAGSGVDAASFKNLATGWNLIATGENKSPSEFNSAIGASGAVTSAAASNFTSLWAWDTSLNKWYFYSPSLDASAGLSNHIQTTGYLDFSASNKKLGHGTGFWVNKFAPVVGTLEQKSVSMTVASGGSLTLSNGAQVTAPPGAISAVGDVAFSRMGSARGYGAATESRDVYELSGPIDTSKASFVFPGKAGLSADTISVVNYDPTTGDGASVPFSYDAATGWVTVVPGRISALAKGGTAVASGGLLNRLGYLVEFEALYSPTGSVTIPTPFYEHLSPVSNSAGTSCWAAASTMLVKSFALDALQDTEILAFLKYLHVADTDYGIGSFDFTELLPRALSLYSGRSVEWRGYVNFTNLRSRLLRELDNGHPVILRWPTHAVLAVGYQYVGPGNYNIVLHDPKGVTPQNSDDGGMYSVRSWDWISARTAFTGTIQLMWVHGEAATARSLQSMGLPSGSTVGSVEFLGLNTTRVPPREDALAQYQWTMSDAFGHSWYRGQDAVAVIGQSPLTATTLRLRLPVWNAANTPATVQLGVRIYDKNLALLYQSPPVPVALSANQASPLIQEVLIPVAEFRDLSKVEANNVLQFRIAAELRNADGTVYRDGWLENNMRGVIEVKPWITSVKAFNGQIVIEGYSFGKSRGTSLVVFSKDLPASVVTWSENKIVAMLPAGAVSGDVVVQLGTSNGNIPSNAVVFLRPTITALSAATAAIGSPLTITGANFGPLQGSSTITLNGATAVATGWSDSQIITTIPTGATSGSWVVNVDGISSNAMAFTVTPSAASKTLTIGFQVTWDSCYFPTSFISTVSVPISSGGSFSFSTSLPMRGYGDNDINFSGSGSYIYPGNSSSKVSTLQVTGNWSYKTDVGSFVLTAGSSGQSSTVNATSDVPAGTFSAACHKQTVNYVGNSVNLVNGPSVK